MKTPEIVGIYELFDAVEAVVKSADPAQRKALAQTIDAYADDFPDEFYWAVGPQAPTFLSHLLFSIDTACRSAPRPPLRATPMSPASTACCRRRTATWRTSGARSRPILISRWPMPRMPAPVS